MTGRFDEKAAIVTDAYIDLLLDRRAPIEATPAHNQLMPHQLREVIELLHAGLPRFHPSFVFEEQLAARLRAGEPALPDAAAQPGELIPLHIDSPANLTRRVDPRVLLGGAAIASGVSVAAVYAWRHAARRARPSREVTA